MKYVGCNLMICCVWTHEICWVWAHDMLCLTSWNMFGVTSWYVVSDLMKYVGCNLMICCIWPHVICWVWPHAMDSSTFSVKEVATNQELLTRVLFLFISVHISLDNTNKCTIGVLKLHIFPHTNHQNTYMLPQGVFISIKHTHTHTHIYIYIYMKHVMSKHVGVLMDCQRVLHLLVLLSELQWVL
jgi:hypothetical protein